MNIGKRIKNLRERRAWSQDQLAEVAGVSVRTVQRIEKGDEPSLETLKSLASAFEIDVAEFTVTPPDQKTSEHARGSLMLRVTSGKDLFAVLPGSHSFGYENDEPKDEMELELLGDFFTGLQDWGDMLAEISARKRLRLEHEYTEYIYQLEQFGFWVFAGIEKRNVKINGKATDWRVARVSVIRSDSPTIVVVDHENVSLYKKTGTSSE